MLMRGQVGLHVHFASRASFWRKSGFFALATPCLLWLILTAAVSTLLIRGRQSLMATERRLAAHADYEHAALMRGDVRTGVFGRYHPSDTE